MLAVYDRPRARAAFLSRQTVALAGMLLVYVLAAVAYILLPGGMLDRNALPSTIAPVSPSLSVWQIVLGNAGLILVGYGLIGLAGLWFTRHAGFPGIYRPGAGWRAWALRPLAIGLAASVVLVLSDLTARRLGYAGFPHPRFPASIAASLSAGIGEEILTRLFVFGLWAFILTWALARLFPGRNTRPVALWIANIIAALAFAASHFPGVMMLSGLASPADLPPFTIAELILLNGFLGILCGRATMRDGLVAASGIHLWADIGWHVIYGFVG